ncbi:MAG: hypothetical protein AAFS10_07535, partial [Myxococcota bacterium]
MLPAGFLLFLWFRHLFRRSAEDAYGNLFNVERWWLDDYRSEMFEGPGGIKELGTVGLPSRSKAPFEILEVDGRWPGDCVGQPSHRSVSHASSTQSDDRFKLLVEVLCTEA